MRVRAQGEDEVSTDARARLTSCRTCHKPSLLRPDRCPAGAGGSEKSVDRGLSGQTAHSTLACAVAPAAAPNTLPAPPSAARSGCRSDASPSSYCRIRTASQYPSLPPWISGLRTGARACALRRAIARNGGDNERMIKVKKSTPHNPRTMCETSGKVLLAACWQKALKSALASPLSRSERARSER